MNIDSLLDLVTIISWSVAILVALVVFLRTWRERGLKAAFRILIAPRTAMVLVFLLSLSIVGAALVFVPPEKVGVVVSAIAPTGIRDQPLRSGLRWIVPLAEKVDAYPIYWQTYTMAGQPFEGQLVGNDSIVARTKDGQEVKIDCSVIFRVDVQQVVQVHIEWQSRYIEDLIRPRTRGLVRSSVAKYTISEVNSVQRSNLEAELDRELRAILADKGLILDAFVLRNITFSPEYAASVEEKQVQEQGQLTAEYEAEQQRRRAQGHADALEIEAQGEAEAVRIRTRAQAEARLIQAQAEAQALQLVSAALANNETLLTYEYIRRLAPTIRTMLVPNDAPLLLSLPSLDGGEPISPTIPIPIPPLTETLELTTTLPFTSTLPPLPTPVP